MVRDELQFRQELQPKATTAMMANAAALATSAKRVSLRLRGERVGWTMGTMIEGSVVVGIR